MKKNKQSIAILVIVSIIFITVGSYSLWRKYNQIKDNNKIEETKLVRISEGDLELYLPRNWNVTDKRTVNSEDYYVEDKSSQIHLKLKGGMFSIEIDSEKNTESQEELMKRAEQMKEPIMSLPMEELYGWQEYDASKYVEVRTIDDIKIVRESLNTVKSAGTVKRFDLYMVQNNQITHQLRILGRDKNTDRINISYLIEPGLDPHNLPPDFEQTLAECDEIVRSLKLKSP